MQPLEPRLSTLMRASLAGDGQAYRTLLAEVAALLRRYFASRLRSHDASEAEDLVQETLIALHTRRGTYDPSRPVSVWVHAIARYKLVDHLRSRKLRAALPLDDHVDELSAADDTEPAMASRDLDRMLATLPVQASRLVRETKLQGRSVAETAARTGLSETAVKIGVHRALKTLASRFGRKDDA